MGKVSRHVLLFSTLVAVSSAPAMGQFKNGSQATELNLPRLSQRASISQRIGITDITIVYHRPQANGRKIFGAAVPYGPVWRAGANENTTISFSDEVSVEGHVLPAGTYGLHAIPGADEWTIIFSKNSTSWGSFSYDEKEDALRVKVKPQAGEMQEALAYTFDDVKPDSVAATLRWEKLAVSFRVSVDVKGIMLRSIKNQLRSTGGFTWAGYNEAVNWCLDNNYNLEEALKWEDISIQSEERFENLETKSRLLEALGRRDEAEKTMARAFEKGSPFQVYTYARGLQRQGNAKRAFEIYPLVSKRDPNHWASHLAVARLDSNSGDYSGAAKEMKLAIDGAPDSTKPLLQPLLKRLENKEDINK